MKPSRNILATAVQSFKSQALSARALRIFLGATWVYAGWDKASDPGFLTKGSSTYIGTQLAAYAQNSPIGSLLQHTIEHAQIVGIFVMLSEFAIGFATLLWVAPATTALSGLAMSIGLWLSSSFHVTPYFLAADTAYAVLWLAYLLSLIGSSSSRGKALTLNEANLERRGFMRVGIVAALAAATSVVAKNFPKASAATTSSKAAASTGGAKIVKLASLPVGGSHKFTSAKQGVPAVLFRTKTGVFAYSAICTHEGCTVSYNGGSKKMQCPCHGAQFDPFDGAKAVAGPTKTPLASIKVKVDGAWVVEA